MLHVVGRSYDYDLEVPLVFPHIFKCGGTAITNPITHRLGPNHQKLKVNTAAFKLPLDNIHEMREIGKDARFITGHGCDGSGIEFMVSIAQRPVVLMTTVRNPIERVFSTYYYLRMDKCNFHPLYNLFNRYQLHEILEKINEQEFALARGFLVNHQTRALSGIGYATRTSSDLYPEPTDSSLSRATETLSNLFSYIGLQEDIDSSWDLLCSRFKLEYPDPYYLWNKQNVTEYEPDSLEVKERLNGLISSMNRLDIALYEWILENKSRINSREVIYVECIK